MGDGGSDGNAINAISACVAGSAGIAGKDGGGGDGLLGRDGFRANARWCRRLEGLLVLPAIGGPRLYQVIGLWIGRPLATLRGLGSGVVAVVAGTASGEEALDDAFEAGHASFESRHTLG